MAFNPFHAFRKYRKQSFAILTIICMFTFVLSSGIGNRGDFFDQLTDFFGGGRARAQGNDVARLNGKKVTLDDVRRLREQRQLANEYIVRAVEQAESTIMAGLERDIGKLSPNFVQQQLQQMVQYKKLGMPIAGQLSQLRMMAQAIGLAGGDKDKDELARIIGTLEQLVLRDERLAAGQRGGYYFDDPLRFDRGNPEDELLDFMVLQVHADRLHIKFTEKDIKDAVNRETMGGLTREKAVEVETALRKSRQGFSPDQLMAALAEELRVRSVRAAYIAAAPRPLDEVLKLRPLLQQASQLGGLMPVAKAPTPDVTTPLDLWTYFRTARTETQVAVVPLDVSAYLAKVTGEPTEEELRKLFDQYKKVEPAPNQESPGFKQPRQVRVQFLTGKAELPYFRKTAAQVFAAVDGAALVGNALTVPAGGGFVVPAVQVGTPVAFNVRLQAVYGEWLNKQPQPWGSTTFGQATIGYDSLRRPEVAAAFAGQLLGTAGTRGALALGPPLGWAQAAMVQHVQASGQRGGTAVLTALGASVSPLGPVSALALPRAVTPPPTPLADVRARLEAQIADQQATEFFIEDLDQVRKDLDKLGKEIAAAPDKDAKKQKQEAFEKAVQEAAAKRGLTVGAGAQADTIYDLIDDPGLKPLRELSGQDSPGDDPLAKAVRFAMIFVRGNPTADPAQQLQASSGPANGGPVFLPIWYPSGTRPAAHIPLPVDRPAALAWKTEDKDAQIRRFDEPGVRDQVKAAWRLLKARELAEQDARKWADEAKAAKGDLPALKDFAARHQRPLFELGPIAQMLPAQTATAGGPRHYQTYSVPREQITYPSAEFINALLKMKDAALGATEVLNDQPKQHFYVVSLVRKVEPTESEFDRSFFAAGGGPAEHDTLFQGYEQQQAAAYRALVMEQLRLDAGLELNTEVRRKDRGGEE